MHYSKEYSCLLRMIYWLIGPYSIRKKVQEIWKHEFQKKYPSGNIFHIHQVDTFDTTSLFQIFFWKNLFDHSKKMIIIDIDENILSRLEKKEKELVHILQKKDEHTYVYIHTEKNVQVKSNLFSYITETGIVKDFTIKKKQDINRILCVLYKNQIDAESINILLDIYGENIPKIQETIEKLLIQYSFLSPPLLQSILQEKQKTQTNFFLIECILSGNFKQAILSLHTTIRQYENIYQWYHAFLSLLSCYFSYILLKHSPSKAEEYKKQNTHKLFLMKKMKISEKQFCTIYYHLLQLDVKRKQGMCIGNQESDFLYEIEKIFLFAHKAPS